MADSDEEQLESIKRWWDENGTSLVVTLVLAVGGVLGYQAWENHVQSTGEAAAAIYTDLLDAVGNQGPFTPLDDEARQTGTFLANQLKEEHGGSSYADLASLFLAKLAVEDGDLEKAEAELKSTLEGGVEAPLEPIVAMRLARVQKAMGNHEAALETLVGVEPGEHEPSWEEIRGDIFLAMGDSEQARGSYEKALAALDDPASRPMLQMKLDDIEAPSLTVPVTEDDPIAAAAAEAESGETGSAP